MENYKYKILINPSTLFKNSEEILEFCKLSKSKFELKAFENELVKEDLFEWAKIVNDYAINSFNTAKECVI